MGQNKNFLSFRQSEATRNLIMRFLTLFEMTKQRNYDKILPKNTLQPHGNRKNSQVL